MRSLIALSFFIVGTSSSFAARNCQNLVIAKAPICGLSTPLATSHLGSISREVAKSIPPEETLTLVDDKGVRSQNYQVDAGAIASGKTPIEIKLDPDKTHQTMYGFGASITESCLENMKKLSPDAKKEFMQKIFDRKNGAGFGYLRVPVGSNDFSMGDYTLNDTPGNKPDPELKSFNAKKMKDFISFVKEAKKHNPELKILISPWTAPAWMKDTKSLKGGQIKKEYYEAYSKYLMKAVNTFESQGIKVDQMTIMNEPLIGDAQTKWFFPQGYMSPEDQNTFIQNNLSPKLKNKNTKILLHDHNWDNAPALDPVLAKNKSNPAVQGMAYHCYGGNYSHLKKHLANNPGVPAFNTECTSTLDKSGSAQDTFRWWQESQSLDAVKSGVAGSLGWNLCLDEQGGPRNNGCQGCRGMVTIDSKTSAMTFNPEFKALESTSKVIDVGSQRINSTESDAAATSVAFKNPDGSLSMVLVNRSKEAQSYNVSVDECNQKSYQVPPGATLSVRWFPQ